jgi:hypothetical protein
MLDVVSLFVVAEMSVAPTSGSPVVATLVNNPRFAPLLGKPLVSPVSTENTSVVYVFNTH